MSTVSYEPISPNTLRLLSRRLSPVSTISTIAEARFRLIMISTAPFISIQWMLTPCLLKKSSVMTGNDVAIFFPSKYESDVSSSVSRTATQRRHLPYPSGKISATSARRSTTRSLPVMPRSTTPELTSTGMSSARTKMKTISALVQVA